MSLIPKLQELVLPATDGCCCETFIYEPSNIDEENLGSLYLVGELTENQGCGNSLLNLLASVIKREFYVNIKRKTGDAFEASLKKANITLADFIAANQFDWTGKIHLICAAINKKNLFLTQIGKAQAALWRNHELVAVCQNLAQAQKNPYPLKAFGSLISGGIMPGDRFILATSSLAVSLNKNMVKQALSLTNLSDTADKLQQQCQTCKLTNNLAILLIEIQQSLKGQPAIIEWEKPSLAACQPIDFSEIVKETTTKRQATIIPENNQLILRHRFWRRPQVIGQHYFRKLKRIMNKD